MDDTTTLLIAGAACTLILSSSSLAMVMLKKHADTKSVGGGPSGSSPGNSASLKGTPLPAPGLEKGKVPWNITWIGNPESMSTEDGELKLGIKKGIHGMKSGAAFRANPWKKLPADSVVLSYEVYFPPTFNWVKGGKLPGVCFGTSENECSTGGEWTPNQGSFRLMWRENGQAIGYSYMAIKGGPQPAFQAQGSAYKDITDTTERTGHDLWKKNGGDLKLKKGWNTVTMELRMNSVGKKDGSISLTINGKNKAVRDVVFRQAPNVKFTSVLVVSFFGGGSSEWNSPVDTYMKYRNFRFDAA